MSHVRQIDIESPYLLLVEGQDEVDLFEVLLDELGLNEDVQVEQLRGRHKLGRLLRGLAVSSDYQRLDSIGIIQDADSDSETRFESICDSIDEHLDTEPPDEVGIFTSASPRVGVLLLPGNGRSGMLETLCLESVEDKEPRVFDCIDQYFDCISNHVDEMPEPEAKARMQGFLTSREWFEEELYREVQGVFESRAVDGMEFDGGAPSSNCSSTVFLASKSKPRLSIGKAAQAGYWDFSSEAFDPVKEFMRRLVLSALFHAM